MRRGRTHGSGTRRVRVMVYGCGAHARNHSCKNAVELPETTMDTAVLESLARALEPATIEAAVQEAVQQERAARAGSTDRRAALERELSLIDARTARLTEAVALGGAAVGPLLAKLGEEATRRQAIERERGGLDALDGAADIATAAVRRTLLRQASQVRAALLAHREEARDVLRTFVPAITFTPYGIGRARGYILKGTGTYGALLGETPRPYGVPEGLRSL